jgi:glucose-6-phosphate-specific signal transduction histidine kinase
VTDDGTASNAGDGRAGRGIADIRAAAAASGGSIEIALSEGARVSAAWPAWRTAANHATDAAGAADRSGMPAR